MKKINKGLKIITFLVIGIFILQILTYIFIPKFIKTTDPAMPRIREFYEQRKNSLDVVFVGNSEGARAFSPIILWENYGITSFNFGSSLQTSQMAYYKIQEILKYQKPKVIVLEVNSFLDKEITEEAYRKVLDNFKLDDIKINAIYDENIKFNDDKLSYVFPILRYHSRWGELKQEDFKLLKQECNSITYKGMAIIVDKKAYKGNKKYMADNGKISQITDLNLLYAKKIIELCQKNNIELLMTELPSPLVWNSEKSNAILKLANEYNVKFIDMNLLQKEIEIDWENDTHDAGGHLNIYGAEKVSNYIGKILTEKYNLPNCKNEANIAEEWNEITEKYENNKKKLEVEYKSKKNK